VEVREAGHGIERGRQQYEHTIGAGEGLRESPAVGHIGERNLATKLRPGVSLGRIAQDCAHALVCGKKRPPHCAPDLTRDSGNGIHRRFRTNDEARTRKRA
jgi:hypothetical protein